MAERELFVVCNNCGNEVSPYVTECPYCGTRLRKRAPDLKKQKKLEEREEQKAEKRRERLRAQYEGGGRSSGERPGAWLETTDFPYATATLVTISIVTSLLAASGIQGVSLWMLEHLVYLGSLSQQPWAPFTAPFIHLTIGYGFVCLFGFVIFGGGIERRFGPLVTVALWLVCGACGVLMKTLIEPGHPAFGAIGCTAGALFAWTVYVVNREDLRDFDVIGLAAAGFVICALPVATDSASVWMLLGGTLSGIVFGLALTRLPSRS